MKHQTGPNGHDEFVREIIELQRVILERSLGAQEVFAWKLRRQVANSVGWVKFKRMSNVLHVGVKMRHPTFQVLAVEEPHPAWLRGYGRIPRLARHAGSDLGDTDR